MRFLTADRGRDGSTMGSRVSLNLRSLATAANNLHGRRTKPPFEYVEHNRTRDVFDMESFRKIQPLIGTASPFALGVLCIELCYAKRVAIWTRGKSLLTIIHYAFSASRWKPSEYPRSSTGLFAVKTRYVRADTFWRGPSLVASPRDHAEERLDSGGIFRGRCFSDRPHPVLAFELTLISCAIAADEASSPPCRGIYELLLKTSIDSESLTPYFRVWDFAVSFHLRNFQMPGGTRPRSIDNS